jgi:hypothetical protein
MGKKINAAALLVLLWSAGGIKLFAEEGSLSATLDWFNMKIDVSVSLNLKQMGLGLPSGRTRAEDLIYGEYFSKIENFIYSIPVDSSSVMSDFLIRGELTPAAVDDIVLDAKAVPPAISADLQRISSSYTIALNEVSSKLITHNSGANFIRIIAPPEVTAYTGIIIIADEELPVHGRNSGERLLPCLFPKIWDSEMNLVYDKKFAEPHIFGNSTLVNYADRDHIFRRTPSGLSPEIESIVGSKPLRIIARGIFGMRPTDPVIDAADAALILASEANRRLLREGKVVLVVSPNALITEFSE